MIDLSQMFQNCFRAVDIKLLHLTMSYEIYIHLSETVVTSSEVFFYFYIFLQAQLFSEQLVQLKDEVPFI